MPKSAKAKLDQSGLTGLGLEKLVEILLDEAAFNKALKSRLLAALAGGAGAGEVTRLIDSKLDSLQKSRAYLSPTRANTLSVELRGLLKNITSELAGLDRYAAFERVLRFLTVGAVIDERARNGGARLAKLMDEARDSLVEAALKLDGEEQVRSVELLTMEISERLCSKSFAGCTSRRPTSGSRSCCENSKARRTRRPTGETLNRWHISKPWHCTPPILTPISSWNN
jgi:hypothetical protein